MKKNRILATVLGSMLLLSMGEVAQRPKRNVSAAKHANLAAAQKFCQQAWERVGAAQQANEFDMQGHAAKAKELLDQANRELKLAAEAANAAKK